MAILSVVRKEGTVPAGRPALTIQDINEPELPGSGDANSTRNDYVPEKRGLAVLPVVRAPQTQPNDQSHESDADDDEIPISPSSSETS